MLRVHNWQCLTKHKSIRQYEKQANEKEEEVAVGKLAMREKDKEKRMEEAFLRRFGTADRYRQRQIEQTEAEIASRKYEVELRVIHRSQDESTQVLVVRENRLQDIALRRTMNSTNNVGK